MTKEYERYFEYLDALASKTEYSGHITKTGPMFYNVPAPYWLVAKFRLKPKQAFAVFTAWVKSRKWKHPREDRAMIARLEESERQFLAFLRSGSA